MRPERLESIIRAAEKAGKVVVRTRVTKDEVVLEYAADLNASSEDGLLRLSAFRPDRAVDLVEWKK